MEAEMQTCVLIYQYRYGQLIFIKASWKQNLISVYVLITCILLENGYALLTWSLLSIENV